MVPACLLPPTPVPQTAFHFFLDSRRKHFETDLEKTRAHHASIRSCSQGGLSGQFQEGKGRGWLESIQQLQHVACNWASPKLNCNLMQSHLLPLILVETIVFFVSHWSRMKTAAHGCKQYRVTKGMENLNLSPKDSTMCFLVLFSI